MTTRCAFAYKKKQNTHNFHMLPISFEWLFSLVKVSPSLPPFVSHMSSFLSSKLSFHPKNSPYSRSPSHSPSVTVLKIIITHIAFFFLHQIHFRMNDAENKNHNPQKSQTCTVSQNLLLGVKPISLCEANEQASF